MNYYSKSGQVGLAGYYHCMRAVGENDSNTQTVFARGNLYVSTVLLKKELACGKLHHSGLETSLRFPCPPRSVRSSKPDHLILFIPLIFLFNSASLAHERNTLALILSLGWQNSGFLAQTRPHKPSLIIKL